MYTCRERGPGHRQRWTLGEPAAARDRQTDTYPDEQQIQELLLLASACRTSPPPHLPQHLDSSSLLPLVQVLTFRNSKVAAALLSCVEPAALDGRAGAGQPGAAVPVCLHLFLGTLPEISGPPVASAFPFPQEPQSQALALLLVLSHVPNGLREGQSQHPPKLDTPHTSTPTSYCYSR